MLGYRPDEFPGRAVFEALGHGQEVNSGYAFAFAALRPAERRADGLWLTGRPRYGEDEEDAAALVDACAHLEVDGLTFALEHVRRGEGILRVPDPADERVTDSDAFFRDRYPVLRPQPLAPEAKQTAAAAATWTRRTMEILDEHPVNAAREERGLPKLNVITLKWWGRAKDVPSFARKARPARDVHRRVRVPPRARHRDRPRHDRCAGDARPCGRPARPPHARERTARSRRHLRLRPPEGDRRGRPHEGPPRQAEDDRGAGRGASRPPDRPRDRLCDRRPLHARVA